jgi:hypothetical protein
MRFVRITLAAGLLAAVAPCALGAQALARPRCKDGTTAERSGITACWFHGGVATAAAVRPKPATSAQPSRPATAKPRPKAESKSKASKKHGKRKAGKSDEGRVFGVPLSTQAQSSRRERAHKSHPRQAKAPKGATARCMDGTYTHATRKRKACSRHGGVAGWLKPDIPPE